MDQRTGEFKMKIGKSRHGGTGHVEHMRFAPLSLAIVADHEHVENHPESGHWSWAGNELTYQTKYRNRWEQALVRHEAGTAKDVVAWAEVERAFFLKRQGNLRVVS
jgi:hypothetical protein